MIKINKVERIKLCEINGKIDNLYFIVEKNHQNINSKFYKPEIIISEGELKLEPKLVQLEQKVIEKYLNRINNKNTNDYNLDINSIKEKNLTFVNGLIDDKYFELEINKNNTNLRIFISEVYFKNNNVNTRMKQIELTEKEKIKIINCIVEKIAIKPNIPHNPRTYTVEDILNNNFIPISNVLFEEYENMQK